jgi:hypothetical protein
MNMPDHSPTGEPGFAIQLATLAFTVAPGQGISIPVLVYNQGGEEEMLTLSIQGVPSDWVSVPSPLIHLAPGEQREMALTVQPPAFPDGRAGRYSLVIQVASQQRPAEVVEKTCTLTVAALEVAGRIGVLLAATEFSVVPGGSTPIPLVLLNQGLDADTFALSVEGIAPGWVYAPVVALSLAPGQQQEVTLTVQPPDSAQTEAGSHPFRIQVNSRGMPGQASEVECVLTIAALTRFAAELRPQRVEAGQPARVLVENQGNVQQTFVVGWQSPGDEVIFEPREARQVGVPPGEVSMVEFRPAPRSRPFLGGEVSLPFVAYVQTPDQETRNLTGEVVTRGLLPGWVLPAVGIALLALIATIVLIAILGGGGSGATPTQVPAIDVPPAVVTQVLATEVPPAVATEAPPTEAPPAVATEVPPTEAPPEAPTEVPATEAPPEAPTEVSEPVEPTQQPPTEEAVQLPADTPSGEGGTGGAQLPCMSIAFGLILVPLLVRSKGRDRKG